MKKIFLVSLLAAGVAMGACGDDDDDSTGASGSSGAAGTTAGTSNGGSAGSSSGSGGTTGGSGGTTGGSAGTTGGSAGTTGGSGGTTGGSAGTTGGSAGTTGGSAGAAAGSGGTTGGAAGAAAGAGGSTTAGAGGTGSEPLAINGCNSFVSGTDGETETWDFSIANDSKRCLQIKAGQSVKFTGDFVTHPLIAKGGDSPNPFSSVTNPSGASATVTVTFPNAGLFGYVCQKHANMTGAIYVVP